MSKGQGSVSATRRPVVQFQFLIKLESASIHVFRRSQLSRALIIYRTFQFSKSSEVQVEPKSVFRALPTNFPSKVSGCAATSSPPFQNAFKEPPPRYSPQNFMWILVDYVDLRALLLDFHPPAPTTFRVLRRLRHLISRRKTRLPLLSATRHRD